VVNKFGIATPSTISPNSNNAGTDQWLFNDKLR
jgi:hypothetical protein